MMKCSGFGVLRKMPAVFLAVQVWGLTMRADTVGSSVHPYCQIASRNLFALKPTPAVVELPVKSKTPAPVITLTGIATIPKKLALFTYQPPLKPGEPPKPVSAILAVGQREGDVEVLAIDEKQRTVQVLAFGELLVLSFERNGPKLAGASRVENPFSRPAQEQPTASAAVEAQRTPEEDTILTEVDRERHRGEANYPPLPPTPLTSQEDLKAIMAPVVDSPTLPPRR